MSRWCALNIAYEEDIEPKDIDTFLSQVNAYEHPNEGFDVLLSVFTSHIDADRTSEVVIRLLEMATKVGTPECLVSIRGGDTSDHFTAVLHNEAGDITSRWDNSYGEGWNIQHDSEKMLNEIQYEIGRRPDLGGNYTNV